MPSAREAGVIDAKGNVVAYTATISVGDRGLGAVYVEVPVEAFRRAIPADSPVRLLVVDASSREVVFDSSQDARKARLRHLTLPPSVNGRQSGILEGTSPTAFRWAVPAGRSWMTDSNRVLGEIQWVALAQPLGNAPGTLAGFTGIALGLLAAGCALGLAGFAGLRLHHRILDRAANHDLLTGLPNRRALMRRLSRAAANRSPLHLALYDLNGFKAYNDNFGHQAGDALLERLGQALMHNCTGDAVAYRLGGDEFCLVSSPNLAAEMEFVGAAALSERGHGFEISPSWGTSNLGEAEWDVSRLLALADQRMYERKQARRANAGEQTREALLRVIEERDPELARHHRNVGELAARTAHHMDLGDELVRIVREAGELHDLGKVALPDALLAKPAPLDNEESAFMARHTLVGERILLAAPDLVAVAALVRSSHERWDGTGYPDRLREEQIPMGARLLAVCDAFDQMTHDSPYRARVSVRDALAELRRCAGTQFDPAAVTALEAALCDSEPPRIEPATQLLAGTESRSAVSDERRPGLAS